MEWSYSRERMTTEQRRGQAMVMGAAFARAIFGGGVLLACSDVAAGGEAV